MEEILGIIFVILFIGFIIFFSKAVDDVHKKSQQEEPFILRFIDKLAEESSKRPSPPSPYQGKEWTSTDPDRTESSILIQEDPNTENIN